MNPIADKFSGTILVAHSEMSLQKFISLIKMNTNLDIKLIHNERILGREHRKARRNKIYRKAIAVGTDGS